MEEEEARGAFPMDNRYVLPRASASLPLSRIRCPLSPRIEGTASSSTATESEMEEEARGAFPMDTRKVGPLPAFINAEVPSSARRGNLLEKDKVLKKVNMVGPLPAFINAEVPSSARRGNLLEKDKVPKKVNMGNERPDGSKDCSEDSEVALPPALIKGEVPCSAGRLSLRTKMLSFAASYLDKMNDPVIPSFKSDLSVEPNLQIREPSDLEKLVRRTDGRRLPIHLLRGSRVVNSILCRNPENQFSKEAFQYSDPDSHPFLRESKRTLCQAHSGFKVKEGMEEYVDEKNFELGIELEETQELYDQITRKRKLSSTTTTAILWKLIDARVEVCRRIRRQIRAVGGSSQSIPPYLIR